jgi:hypothetical protein
LKKRNNMKVYLLCLIILFSSSVAQAGSYSLSAHGDNSVGVERSALSALGYVTGNCAHCHEQHASIGGDEPDPTGGPDNYLLFNTNYTAQDTAFCFDCHQDGWGSYQDSTSRRTNYSYSYWFGNSGITCPDSILEAFSFINESGSPVSNCGSNYGSSHKLTDILNFITGQWGYTNDSNPCCGCHNPHAAKVPPSTTTASSPISLPSAHANKNTWGIYSDTMSDYITTHGGTYQPPNKVGGGTELDATKLPDYITFCQDCHSTLTGYGLTHSPIDWSSGGDKHGQKSADGSIDIDSPYSSTLGKVLSCLDCHEPHGAPNVTLIREEVNGAVLTGTISTLTPVDCTAVYSAGNKYLGYLCNRCHKDDADAISGTANNWCYVHHQSSDAFYTGGMCGSCHQSVSGGGGGTCNRSVSAIDCNCCHYHGSTYSTWGTF